MYLSFLILESLLCAYCLPSVYYSEQPYNFQQYADPYSASSSTYNNLASTSIYSTPPQGSSVRYSPGSILESDFQSLFESNITPIRSEAINIIRNDRSPSQSLIESQGSYVHPQEHQSPGPYVPQNPSWPFGDIAAVASQPHQRTFEGIRPEVVRPEARRSESIIEITEDEDPIRYVERVPRARASPTAFIESHRGRQNVAITTRPLVGPFIVATSPVIVPTTTTPVPYYSNRDATTLERDRPSVALGDWSTPSSFIVARTIPTTPQLGPEPLVNTGSALDSSLRDQNSELNEWETSEDSLSLAEVHVSVEPVTTTTSTTSFVVIEEEEAQLMPHVEGFIIKGGVLPFLELEEEEVETEPVATTETVRPKSIKEKLEEFEQSQRSIGAVAFPELGDGGTLHPADNIFAYCYPFTYDEIVTKCGEAKATVNATGVYIPMMMEIQMKHDPIWYSKLKELKARSKLDIVGIAYEKPNWDMITDVCLGGGSLVMQ